MGEFDRPPGPSDPSFTAKKVFRMEVDVLHGFEKLVRDYETVQFMAGPLVTRLGPFF